MTDTITIIDTAEIGKTISSHELKGASADELQATFAPIFDAAKQWREKAAGIKVTNLAQTAVMGEARKTRLEIQKVRKDAERAKDSLKADSLRYGRAVQGLYNTILELTEPVEKYLLDQEKYGEKLREKHQNDMRDLRTHEFGKYIEFLGPGIDLGTIGDEDHSKYLHLAKTLWNAREAENAKAEQERIEKEQHEAAERARILAENERLKVERIALEAQREKEREAAEKAQREADAAIAAERAEADKLRREAAEKEQAERERIAAENRAKMEADNAERERARKDQQDKEAAEKAALEAPDKEKLRKYAEALSYVDAPIIQSNELNEVYTEAKDLIRKAIKMLLQN